MEKFEQEESVQVDNLVALLNLQPSTLPLSTIMGQGAHWSPGQDCHLVV